MCVPPGVNSRKLSEIIMHKIPSKSLQSCCCFSISSRNGHSHSHLPKIHEGHDVTCTARTPLVQGTPRSLCCPFCMSRGCAFHKIPRALSCLGQGPLVYFSNWAVLDPTAAYVLNLGQLHSLARLKGRVSWDLGTGESSDFDF